MLLEAGGPRHCLDYRIFRGTLEIRSCKSCHFVLLLRFCLFYILCIFLITFKISLSISTKKFARFEWDYVEFVRWILREPTS